MSNGLYFAEGVENPAIIFSVNTMTIIKVGDSDYIKDYYSQMQKKLHGIDKEEIELMRETSKTLGLTSEDIEGVLASMRTEYHYLEIPKDEELLNRISTQNGLRDYLVERGQLIVMDDVTDIEEAITKHYN